jgi:hypothetical protein
MEFWQCDIFCVHLQCCSFLSHPSSLLIIYNGLNPECQVDDRVEVRLIDFAQTITPLSSFYDESQHRWVEMLKRI